ncbi:putative acyl-CoA dehydrogenase FadE17 [Candidatus Phycosocius bacilliformis]|uniref:Putative acyl-CoA dehydrogenase FadE17 n=1 Tax=Candidatus Phycosocius bacilliformis TaxID=1445552 RepID=A0A2P2E8A7_9PROT|nr:acyl-CoA dehydrogenase family protein [Candidatus Phycosocius bacilliformis]GBF57293.1 putative acyl-CoA dehydrogenase FadE17 [Candidatus Phycosocius bacilliformis]
MDFNDTPEEAAFRQRAQAFLAAHAEPKSAQKESLQKRLSDKEYMLAAKAYQKAKAENGFAGITWPKEQGGQGLAPIFSVIFGQEEGKYDAPAGPFTIGLGMCVPTVIAFATDAQKARHVGPALRGEEIWCQLFSEPSAGSDVAGLKTRAVRDGDDWVINGQKVWTSGAHYSDWGIVLVRTNPDKAKHKGLSMFFIDMKSPGIEVRPIHQMSGGSNFNEVYFTDVRVPHAQMLGGEGNGWSVALVTLMNERLAVGGSPGPDYKEIFDWARTMPGMEGGSLAEDAAFRQKVADWYVRAEGYKLAKFRTMTALSKGQTPGPESSIGKIITANQLQDITHNAMEAMDHFGIITDAAHAPAEGVFQQSHMWAAGLRIAGGTDEILKNIIAERILGLPGDVRVDKDVAFKDLPSGR